VGDDLRSPASPVAIRITRPYSTEDEFLEQELDTLTRTSVTLLGAQARPQGVVLRFELVLSSGHVLVRGEGRVVGFKPNAHHALGGLTLRFTRLDSKSKALVDKAAALRERRRPSAMPGVPHAPVPSASNVPQAPSTPPPVQVSAPPGPPRRSQTPPPLPPRASGPPPLPPSAAAGPPPLSVEAPAEDPPFVPPAPLFDLDSTRAEAPSAKRPAPPPAAPPVAPAAASASAVPPAVAPADRDALLERLRSRAKALDATAVKQILETRRSAR
jgi:hypothetical protein